MCASWLILFHCRVPTSHCCRERTSPHLGHHRVESLVKAPQSWRTWSVKVLSGSNCPTGRLNTSPAEGSSLGTQRSSGKSVSAVSAEHVFISSVCPSGGNGWSWCWSWMIAVVMFLNVIELTGGLRKSSRCGEHPLWEALLDSSIELWLWNLEQSATKKYKSIPERKTVLDCNDKWWFCF